MDAQETPATLEVLLQRLREGDPAAREVLFESLYGPLRRLSQRMLQGFPGVRAWEEAEDVLHNALLRLLRSLPRAQPASLGELRGRAAAGIHWELLSLARRYGGPQWRHTHPQLDAGSGRPPSGEEVPDQTDEPDDLDTWSAFHHAVEMLPAAEREVVDLAFYHRQSQSQIAEVLHLSERTVQRRWHSAVEKLRRAVVEA